jgi:RNAse (barnase) inhibitor barstar
VNGESSIVNKNSLDMTFVLAGEKIGSLESFYDEIDCVLTKDIDWRTGRNFNALNDILTGGFGVHEYEEPVTLIWQNHSYSKKTLGIAVFEHIVELIQQHEHISLQLSRSNR